MLVVVVVVVVVTVAVAIKVLLLLLIMGFGVVEVKGILVKFLLDRSVVVAVKVVVRVVLLTQLRYGHWLGLGRWSWRHCSVGVFVVKVKEEVRGSERECVYASVNMSEGMSKRVLGRMRCGVRGQGWRRGCGGGRRRERARVMIRLCVCGEGEGKVRGRKIKEGKES